MGAFREPATRGWFNEAAQRLGPVEFRRRLWHYAPGVLALAAAAIPYYEPVPAPVLIAATVFGLTLAVVASGNQQSIRRAGERNCLSAIWGYGVAVIPLFLLFPRQPELPLTVAAIIAFGDGSATLFGILAGKTKLPWNRHKSWVGSTAFILAATPAALMIYWAASIPHPSFTRAALCAGTAVLVTAMVESLPIRLNDNAFVGTAAAVSVTVMHGLVIGWQ